MYSSKMVQNTDKHIGNAPTWGTFNDSEILTHKLRDLARPFWANPTKPMKD
ncbi:MAG: hypothetical protein JW841_15925 [Deltaproteobacteria bacterium]|nr:hypothetical protein [Deltaproteobacteria bacterium]